MVLKIAKAELRNLFYSPVAWVLIVAFFVQCAYFYTSALYPFANSQDIFIRNNPKWTDWHRPLTFELFMRKGRIFQYVLQNLYLFIPLLTMGVIGREIQTGTIKLLFSSPVKLRQIVLGKYLALTIYNVLLVLIAGIFLITGMINIQGVEYGVLLSAALGFFLLSCAYTAIGVFMSSLSTYQIVTGIGTFLVIFLLSKIGGVWQKYDFIRDLTWFLNMAGRAEKMLKGLLTTKDVIYFLVIVYMFLGLTLLKLKSGRESKPWPIVLMRYSFVIVSGLLIGYISSHPFLTGYWDTTSQNTNTVSGNTQKIIKDMGDEPLEITLYTNLLGSGNIGGLPENRNGYQDGVWEKYQRFKSNINFKYVYYYDHDSTIQGKEINQNFSGKTLEKTAKRVADFFGYSLDMFNTPTEIKKIIDLKPEGLRLVMQLKYKGRTAFLRTYDDTQLWPDEQHIAGTLKRLLQPVPSMVAFAAGNLERNVFKKGEREFRDHTSGKESRTALVNLGLDVDTVSLDLRDIPAGIATLVIADPKVELTANALNRIKQYSDRGGNIYILGEPGKQHLLNPILQPMGVKLMDGILVRPTFHEKPDMVDPHLENACFSLAMYPESPDFIKVPHDDVHVLMPGVTAVSWSDTSGYKTTPMFSTVETSTWLKAGKLVADSATVTYNQQEGDLRGLFATTVAMTKKVNNKQQRIIVSGDADYMSNIRSETQAFGMAFHCWLTYGGYPVVMPRHHAEDNRLNITGKSATALGIIYVYVLPGLVLLGGIILLIRRKRK